MHAYAIGAKADMATKNALPHEAEKFGRFVFTKNRKVMRGQKIQATIDASIFFPAGGAINPSHKRPASTK